MPRLGSIQVNRGRGASVKKRRRQTFKELSITSLLDILTILLVFMIKNVSMDAASKNAPEGMVLPNAISIDKLMESSQVVTVKVYTDKILYGTENAVVGTIEEFMNDQSVKDSFKKQLKIEADLIKRENNKEPVLLIQADKDLKCKYLGTIIGVSTVAKFGNIYFSTTKVEEKKSVISG